MSHLMLSRHGIWYYRRVYLTPRKRREIRISLRTRSRREALLRVEKYLTSQPLPCVPQAIPAHTSPAAVASFQNPQKKPSFKNLLSELKKYTSAKAGSVGEREILTINRCVNAYLASTKDPFSKRSAADFVDNLEGSAYTRNRYIKKSSAFSRWLATRTAEELRNPFEGMGVRETTAPMDRRPAYTLSDLKRLHIAIKEVKDWRRWIILICQYSGIRQNEACQLYHNDVMQIEGIWCLRLDDLNSNQKLKTYSSRRFVPVHPHLLALGFLDFVNESNGHFSLTYSSTWEATAITLAAGSPALEPSTACQSSIHCGITPPQRSNSMGLLNSTPHKCLDTAMRQLPTTDAARGLRSLA